MAKGHREAAPRVLDGREHDGTLAAEGRPLTTRHIAVYPRILTAANNTSAAICSARSSTISSRYLKKAATHVEIQIRVVIHPASLGILLAAVRLAWHFFH